MTKKRGGGCLKILEARCESYDFCTAGWCRPCADLSEETVSAVSLMLISKLVYFCSSLFSCAPESHMRAAVASVYIPLHSSKRVGYTITTMHRQLSPYFSTQKGPTQKAMIMRAAVRVGSIIACTHKHESSQPNGCRLLVLLWFPSCYGLGRRLRTQASHHFHPAPPCRA